MGRNNTMGRWWQAKGLEARSFPSLFVQGRILFLHRMEQPAGFFQVRLAALGCGCALPGFVKEIRIGPEIPEQQCMDQKPGPMIIPKILTKSKLDSN